MADTEDWSGLYNSKAPTDAPTWGDYGRVAEAATEDLGSSVASVGRLVGEAGNNKVLAAASKYIQQYLGEAAEDNVSGMTPSGRERLEAAFTSPEFWEHPFSAMALKTTRMAPATIAALIPGGLVGDAIAATAVSGATFGAMNSAQGVNDIYKITDKLSDEQLQKQFPYYASLRSLGVEEDEARADASAKLRGMKPALDFIIGAGAAALGPLGSMSRGIAGGAGALVKEGTSRAGSAVAGALEGGVGMGAQSGVSDATTQAAEIEAGSRKDFDYDQLARNILEGSVMGALPGAAAGAAFKGHGAEAKADERVETPSPPPKGVGTGVTPPPRTDVEVGNPGSEPTRSEKLYPKEKSAGEGGEIQTTEAIGPDVTQAAAVADSAATRSAVSAVPPEVAAAADRVAQGSPAPQPASQLAPREQTQARPQPPPEVMAAADRVAQQRPVTPEVTPPPEIRQAAPATDNAAPSVPTGRPTERPTEKPVETRPAASPDTTPAPVAPIQEARARVLESLTPEAKIARAQQREASRQMNARASALLRGDKTGESDETPSTKSHKSNELQERAANNDRAAQDLVDAHPPTEGETDEAMIQRAQNMVRAAEQNEVAIPERLKGEKSPAITVLREAADLVRATTTKSWGVNKKYRTEALGRFRAREGAARAGDTAEVLASRRTEGDEIKRISQGNPEDASQVFEGVAPGTGATRVKVRDSETKSGTSVRDSRSEERPPSPVRKVVLTPEEKAEIERQANAKPNDKPAPKLAPKAAEAKARVEKANADTDADTDADIDAEIARVKAKIAEKKATKSSIDQAAKKADTAPTEAQKEAGNYAKGHVNIQGLDITIENPRGTQRSGVGPDGKPWSVKVPDHYGYIRRTEGADGDHVDVYVGKHPESEHVLVVDQVNPDTREFNEHKALVGYKNDAEALDAYERGFSDGRGLDRVGKMTHMTMPEFKAWLKRGDTTKPLSDEADVDLQKEAISSPLKEGGPKLVSEHAPEGVRPMFTLKAREALEGLDTSELAPIPKALAGFMQRQLARLAGDTPVHIISREDMVKLKGDRLGEQTHGLHNILLEDGTSRITLRADKLEDPAHAAHVVLHEVAHAATVRALVEDPHIHAMTTAVMREVDEFLRHVPDIRKKLDYAMTNTKEFVAEAFSNPEVQEVLSSVPVSDKLARALGMDTRPRTMWDVMVNMVRSIIEKTTGSLPHGQTAIAAVMRIGAKIESKQLGYLDNERTGNSKPIRMHDAAIQEHTAQQAFIHSELSSVGDAIQKITEKVMDHGAKQEQEGKPWALGWRTTDNIAQVAAHYFGDSNPVRKIADITEQMRTLGAEFFQKSEPIIERLYKAQRKYEGTGEWKQFAELAHDETMAGVFADRPLKDQEHLGKDTLHGAWPKAQHADLSARYEALPDDLKALHAEAMGFFTEQQNKMSLGIMENRVLQALGIEDKGLAKRIFDKTTTDDDKERLGPDTLKNVQEASELAKVSGPYFPLARRGNHVVIGRYDIEAPPATPHPGVSAKPVMHDGKASDNEFEFSGKDARKAAMDWAAKQDTRPSIKSVWVDKTTGERFVKDDDGEEVRVTPQDLNAEQRFVVTVQDRHVEFHESKGAALRAAAELENHPGIKSVEGVQERKFMPSGLDATMASSQVRALMESIEKRSSYRDMSPSQKNELVQALNDASMRMLPSTRIQTKRMPRTYVEGASKDLVRNALDYAHSTATYLAKLQHAPELQDAMKDMRDQVSGHDKRTLGRSAIANEIERRAVGNNGFTDDNKFGPAQKRLMTLSFLDKLMSSSYSIVNALQPAMVTTPVLAARHGATRAVSALARAYSDISALDIIKRGARNTARKVVDPHAKISDFITDIKSAVKEDEGRMLDRLMKVGSVDPESGFELSNLIKQRGGVGGKVDTGLSYLEGIAKQMPKAIESINRVATALAAYRLERSRGADFETATRYAQETTNNTQFLYSNTNQAPVFNHPLYKLALQFKKYGQGMYQLMGLQIGKALRGANPGDRAEALKTLAGIAATHVAMAGTLGLPTEPFKYLMLGAQAAGIPVPQWQDLENWERKVAAGALGQTGGELLTHGLPRALGIDLSSRIGLDSLTSFGEPKSNKDTDVKSWLFDTLAGAPVSLVGDWFRGAGNIASGDFTKAAELMVPMKFASDSIRAYRTATEGKKNAAGRTLMTPYGPGEVAARVLGFTPEREAEEGAKAAEFARDSKQDKDKRSSLTNAWVKAKGSEKSEAWVDIQKFNRDRPKEAQITMSSLQNAAKKKTEDGIKATKQNKYILDKLGNIYNTSSP